MKHVNCSGYSSNIYLLRDIESKWQHEWNNNKLFKVDINKNKPKYYVLDMFPYPSGDGLHVGHVIGYTATDIISRYKYMNGFNVLHPMGWDSFGLPAERHAMRTGKHPKKIIEKNCANFKKQIISMGFLYDWDREVNTSHPNYYKWTQFLFKLFYNNGLAYEKESPVNWCPKLNTVLANEEVFNGKYIETGDDVEVRQLKQWHLKITDFAEELLNDLDELDWPESIKQMQREWIGKKVEVVDGEEVTTYKLRDWLFSRQRYWGEPFPILKGENDDIQLVDDNDLPVELPYVENFEGIENGNSILTNNHNWLYVEDTVTGCIYKRETNTMPQWAGSCWYYLRYMDANNNLEPWSDESQQYWLPVDLYIGGAEHAVLHLLYARFWHKVFYKNGLVSTKEPFKKLYNQGMMLSHSYKSDSGQYYKPEDVEFINSPISHHTKETNIKLNCLLEKMSKSKLNVVNLDYIINEFGADSLRLYVMFMGPLDKDKIWTYDGGLDGMFKFVSRVLKLFNEITINETIDIDVENKLNILIKDVTDSIEQLQFNIAIAKLISFNNHLLKLDSVNIDVLETYLKLLNPFAPHICEELWVNKLNNKFSILNQQWPIYEEVQEDETFEIIIQINSKPKIKHTFNKSDEEDYIKSKSRDLIKSCLTNKKIKKEIYIKNRLINFVV